MDANLVTIVNMAGEQFREKHRVSQIKFMEKLSNDTHLIVCCLHGPSQLVYISKNHHSIAFLVQ